MKVLIGITSKNRAAILPKAIASALNQQCDDKIVAVFDDASTDGTALLVKDYPQVQWTISDIPRGLMYARNFFLEISDAEYFCSLDDDAWFLAKDTLQQGLKYLDANEDVAAIAFDILSPDDSDNEEAKLKAINPVETNIYIGCGHILRVSAAKQAGGYLSSPGFYGSEEKDLCIRLIDQGHRIIKMEGLYVWHDKTNIARDQLAQHRSGVCNDLVFMWRRTPFVFLIPALFSKLFKHIIFSARYKKVSLVNSCMKGIGDFIKILFSFNIQRKAVSLKAFKKYISFN